MRRPTTSALRCLALLWWVIFCPLNHVPADAQDPFSLIFRENELDASDQDTPGQDDVMLVELRLRRLLLAGDFVAYRTTDDVCLPLAPLFETLNFPIEVSETGLEGWFGRPDQIVELAFETGMGRRGGAHVTLPEDSLEISETGPCLGLDALNQLLGFPFTYEERNLVVRISPEQVLPIEARLERESYRRALAQRDAATGDELPLHETPYRWLSMPIIDVSLAASANSQGASAGTARIEAASDLLHMTARLRGQLDSSGSEAPMRFTLERKDINGRILDPVGLTLVEIGDIASPSLDLMQSSQIGRGFRVSNASLFQADVFDRTSLRGPLPVGWEAELHANGELIAFVTEPDALGDYVFDNVVLTPGYNRLTVKLFGPYGEIEEIDHTRFVGSELMAENEVTWEVGFLVPDPETELTELDGTAPTGSIVQGSARYGLTQTTSLRADGLYNLDSEQASFGLSVFGSVLDSYVGVRAVSDSAGGRGMMLRAQRRISPTTTLNLSHAQISDLVDVATGNEMGWANSFGRARLTTVLIGFGYRFPLRLEGEWQSGADGRANYGAGARVSGSYRGVFWSQTLGWSQSRSASGEIQSLTRGELLFSRSLREGRLRAGLGYDWNGRLHLRDMDLVYQRRGRAGRSSQFRLSRDFDSGRLEAASQWSFAFGPAQASASAGLNDAGQWSAGLSLAFSLLPGTGPRHYQLAQPGLSRTGALRTRVFDDLDQDGVFDPGEPGLEAVEYIVGDTLRSEASIADGTLTLDGIEPYRPTSVEVKLSTLNDAFLRPATRGARVLTRPGRIVDLPVPIILTGDIEGQAVLLQNDYEMPVSGVLIEAVDASGQVVSTSRTEYDGYFYLGDVPATSIVVRVAAESLNEAGGHASPLSVALSRNTPSVSGVKIAVTL